MCFVMFCSPSFVLRRSPAFTCQDKLVKLFVSQEPTRARKKLDFLYLLLRFFWLCLPEVLCVSRKVTKQHGKQGKLRTLMNRWGAVEDTAWKQNKEKYISAMVGLTKFHTQNAFTIEMSIMFYDIAAMGPRKTNQGDQPPTARKIFSFAWQILTCNSNQKRRLRPSCPGGSRGLRLRAPPKQDSILWPVLRCSPEIGQKQTQKKVQTIKGTEEIKFKMPSDILISFIFQYNSRVRLPLDSLWPHKLWFR